MPCTGKDTLAEAEAVGEDDIGQGEPPLATVNMRCILHTCQGVTWHESIVTKSKEKEENPDVGADGAVLLACPVAPR